MTVASEALRVARSYRLANVDLPLLGEANVWVEDSIQDRTSISYAQWILQQALENTAPGQLELIVYDATLSGLSAPFVGLNGGGERLLTTLNDPADFKKTLEFLRDHVQAVNDVIQGLAPSLVEFRKKVDYPVEGYKIVVLSADVTSLDDDTQNLLAILMNVGPAAGVTFIVHSMTLDVNPYLIALCDKVTCRRGTVAVEGYQPIKWLQPAAEGLITTGNRVAKALATMAINPTRFDQVETEPAGVATSEDGVTFAIGRYGQSKVQITLGDELNQRHNMLITGAVGQGKSNLLSVIIHSLAHCYSPAELEMYLLDFKEGVTLQRFMDARTGVYLPHARVLGLEADREFGLSVFRHLFTVYRERMRLFKQVGVANIREYRRLGKPMPRVVVLIDEFQLMFSEKDRLTDEIADLLIKGVRLFRASGIHIVLASQTIGGNLALIGSAGEGLFGQVPVRVALKNSLSESHATLGPKNDAAAHLRAREAVVNLDYGAVSSNRKTSIAYADEALLAPLRRRLWEQYRNDFDPPYVFAGDQARSFADDQSMVEKSQHPSAVLGYRIEVDAKPLQVELPRDAGRNVAVLGTGAGVAEMQSVAISLAAQASTKPMRFVVLDLLDSDAQWAATKHGFIQHLAAHEGVSADLVGKESVVGTLQQLADEVLAGRTSSSSIFVMGMGMQRLRSLPAEFEDLVRSGPTEGVHIIGWWTKLDSFKNQVGYGGEAYFDVRVVLQMEPHAVKQVMNDPLLDWKSASNRALAWDVAEMPTPVPIIPYSQPVARP